MTARRYLWPLGGGKFLVRQRNTYSLTDASLKLHPYIDVATPVLATEVSPDGRILVVEHQYERHTPEEHRKLEAQAEQYGEPPPAEDTQITLLNIASQRGTGCAANRVARSTCPSPPPDMWVWPKIRVKTNSWFASFPLRASRWYWAGWHPPARPTRISSTRKH